MKVIAWYKSYYQSRTLLRPWFHDFFLFINKPYYEKKYSGPIRIWINGIEITS